MSDAGITAEDLLALVKPRTGEVALLLDQDLAAAHQRLQAELTDALLSDEKENRHPVAPKIVDQIRALEAEIDAAKIMFRFKAIGRRAWQDLMLKHPPSKDVKKIDPRAQFDPERFPVAAVAASLVEPKMSVEQVALLEQRLTEGQFSVLWGKCVDVNVGGGDIPKLPTFGRLARLSELSAATADPGESPAPSFLDG